MSKHGEEATRQLIELHRADTLGQALICRHRLDIFEDACTVIDELLQEESCFSLKDLAVNGHDMIALGIRGAEIGTTLQMCLDAVLDEQVPNEHGALLALVHTKQENSWKYQNGSTEFVLPFWYFLLYSVCGVGRYPECSEKAA